MNKENLAELIDDLSIKEKQINFTLPKSQSQNVETGVDAHEYNALLSDLILLALPSPSAHFH